MRQYVILFVVVFCAFAILAFVNMESALAFDGHSLLAENPEDKVFNILERVLDMISDFLRTIFQHLAEAIKSIFSDKPQRT